MTPFRAFVTAGLTLLACVPAAAQSTTPTTPYRTDRPYRGLFGGGAGDFAQQLSASGHIGSGWDENILLNNPGFNISDPRFAKSGIVTTGGGNLSYSVNKDRVSLGASGGSSVNYYPSLETREWVTSHYASVGLGVGLSQRTDVAVSESVTYQPYSFTSLFPMLGSPLDEPLLGGFEPPPLDVAMTRTSYFSSTGSVHLTHRVTRRLSTNLGYTDQTSQTAYSSGHFRQQGGSAGMSYSLSRGLSLHLGYGYRQADYGSRGPDQKSHNIDAGIDFNRALSVSRRTTLQFSTGSVAVSNGETTQYHATGSARLNHEVGRTWRASAGYDRSVQFNDSILEPVFYDAMSAEYGGLLNRRTQLNFSVRASLGNVGSRNGPRDQFDTTLASANLSYALSRFVSLSANYGYYRYHFDQGVPLPPGVANNIDRQSIRGNVNLWAPIFTRSRRPNAAR